MKKIMLVMEDFNEMVYVEALLKKLGFDCMGLQNDSGLADKILGFGPALIICDGFGRKVNGLQISAKLKRSRGLPKLILVMTPPQTLDPTDQERCQIDGVMARPVHPVALVDTLGASLGLDAGMLKDKLVKLGLFQENEKEKFKIVSGKVSGDRPQLTHLKETSLEETERRDRFEAAVTELTEPPLDGLDHKKVVEQVREFRARENDPEIQAIDEERMAFVKALFKK